MDDFLEPLTDGLPEAARDVELPGMESMVENTLSEIGRTAELDDGDASWLETLLHRMFSPITDFFDHSENGYDTERISPVETRGEADEVIEGHHIAEAAEQWHIQEGDNSCAVCSQQFIINEFLDLELSEEQLCEMAEANGWFDPEEGTSPRHVGNLLELFGIDTHVDYEGTIQDIKDTLDQGGRVIAAVDSMALWIDGFGNYPLYGADHAIEVIGIDDSDPLNVRVIVNDSGIENGCGRSVPYLEFMEAWLPGGGFMVSAFPGD